MRSLLLILGFLLLNVSCLFAGPVIPADLDANALWYGHVDMEAIMNLPLVKELHRKAIDKNKGKNFMARLGHKIGMQLMGEFLSATMYSTQYEGEFGVVLMKFKNDLPKDNLHAIFAQKCPDRKETRIGHRTAYSWNMRCGRKRMQVSGCFVNDRQILIGRDLHHLERALEVLDGRRPAMANGNPLFKGLTPGVLFVSRAIAVPAAYQGTTYCPVLRHCHEAFARWTCFGNDIRGRYEFQANDREKAALYLQAIEGMKAMFSLRFSDHDRVMHLLDGFSCSQEGKSIILTWEGKTGQVKKAVNQIRQRRRIQRKQRKADNEELL